MVDFVATAYAQTAFYLVMAGLLFWYAQRAPEKFHFIPVRTVLFANIILYVGLAHLAAFSAVGFAVEETVEAPCENVINQSDEINATTVTYIFQDSCEGLTAPDVVVKTMIIFDLAVKLMFLQLFIFITIYAFTWWRERW